MIIKALKEQKKILSIKYGQLTKKMAYLVVPAHYLFSSNNHNDVIHRYSLLLSQLKPSMDEKTQRYMQRIEQIMHISKRATTSYRPSKSPISCKPNHLDTYLKYELSAKIIQKIIDKNQEILVNQFFNIIRTTQFRQKEKIYKFIAVQKSERLTEIEVDSTILCKVLASALKSLIRQRYNYFMNCLQQMSHIAVSTPQKPKTNRKLSAFDSSPVHGRMRTLTNISKMQKKSSNLSEIVNRNETENEDLTSMKNYGLKIVAKLVSSKLNVMNQAAFFQIQAYGLREKCKKIVQQPILQPTTKPKKQALQGNAFKRGSSTIKMVSILSKNISAHFNRIKKYNQFILKRIKYVYILSKKITTIVQRHKFKSYHYFLSSIRWLKINKPAQADQDFGEKSNRSNLLRSHKSHESQELPSNPMAKLSFYSFIDKIVRLIIILSKLLIPLKEAFVKIDQYASFAYRLEQSFKAVHRHNLQQNFLALKRFSGHKKIKITPQITQKINSFKELISPLIKISLIQAFTHVKIMSKQRDLKIKILPAKDNIIQLTKKFITARDQYTTQSHQNWQELKNALLAPLPKDNLRKRSSIIP